MADVVTGALTMCVGSLAVAYLVMLFGANAARIIRAAISHLWG
jgi:hypothetical protein